MKPQQTRTLIKQHAITLDEQRELYVTISKDVRNERQKEAITEKRRAQGVQSASEYQASRKVASNDKLERLRALLTEQPDLSQRKAAQLLGCSVGTVNTLRKQL